jgi:SAM-dependent methyltransferase
MVEGKSFTQASFDDCATDYDLHLSQGLAITGESKDYFARGRIAWLAACLREIEQDVKIVMDFGCGNGSSTPYLIGLPNAHFVIGVDVSRESVELAKRHHASERVQFSPLDDYRPHGRIDLVYCNGVFHHIRPRDRAGAVSYIHDSLRPGGLFALWENNPWNPGARYVMHRTLFDGNAIVLSPPEARRMLKDGGFQILHTHFQFIFPQKLAFFRGAEAMLAKLPLGAQYQILSRKLR